MKLKYISFTLFSILTAGNLNAMDHIKLYRPGLTEKILEGFFAACKGSACNTDPDSGLRRTHNKNKSREESYKLYTNDNGQIAISSTFSAEDEAPYEFRSKAAASKKLDVEMTQDHPKRSLNESSIGTVQDRGAVQGRFTICKFFRYQDLKNDKFKSLYACETEIDPQHKEWVEQIKKSAQK